MGVFSCTSGAQLERLNWLLCFSMYLMFLARVCSASWHEQACMWRLEPREPGVADTLGLVQRT